MGKYSLIERRMVIQYETTEGKYVVTGNLFFLSLFLFLSIKILLRRVLINISVFISPYKLRQTQNVNSTQEQEISRKGGVMVK